MNKQNTIIFWRWLARLALFALVLMPFFYWQPFFIHFRAYLTGTVLTGLIKNQWHLALFFILLFMLFVLPLTYRKRAKWVDYGLVSAFFVSLFIEMYGLPLTVLFASKYLFAPGVELPANVVEFNFLGVGMGMDHAMVYGAILMCIGTGLIALGWRSLYLQAKSPGFARAGLYSVSRHPQYLGFILLLLGWFFGWPTLLTLAFTPLLIYKYVRAAYAEEKYMLQRFGSEYENYKKISPFLI